MCSYSTLRTHFFDMYSILSGGRIILSGGCSRSLTTTVGTTLTHGHTVHIKKTCPNLREEYSSCGSYKFTCKHCICPRTSIERFLHSPLYTKNKEQPKLGARYSNSRGMGLLERWVVVRVACLPLPVQP